MLWLALDFPGLAPGQLPALAAWACQFTPKVSLEPPNALLAEVAGSLRYFGGREGFLRALRAGLAELQFPVSIASADTARAALWLARGEGAASIAELPLEVTGWDLEFLRTVGISTIGELASLPREGLARRCPRQVLDDLERAFGGLPEPRGFFSPPERFDAKLELPAPVTQADALVFAARRLLVQLEGLLAARHAGIRAFSLLLTHASRATRRIEIKLASAARDAERLCALLRERLSLVELGEPVEEIGIEAGDFVPLAAPSGSFFGDAAADAEDWARLRERLETRLGRSAVYGLTTVPDHRPEYAWRRVEPGDWDAHEFRQPGPRPAWLIEPPRRLDEAGLTLLSGPERIECGWWDGDDARRDYFVARLGVSLAWIYREQGEWYLHGFFA
jgi:protein ImuB